MLCRRTKNNPVLIGEPGVGKTAIVEGLAQKIVDGDVPHFLADKRILALDLSLIVAGTKYRGQFEERLKTIMKELIENPNIIVFIDELHTLVGAGSAEGSLDAANILKPALVARRDPVHRRDHAGRVPQVHREGPLARAPLPGRSRWTRPAEGETIKILLGIKDRYEKFHHVDYTREAIEAAVYQSSRYITDRFLPDKAIDLIDEAGARVKLREAGYSEEFGEINKRIHVPSSRWRTRSRRRTSRRRSSTASRSAGAREPAVRAREVRRAASSARRVVVGKDDIDDVVSKWTGVPLTSINEDEGDKLLRMEEELHRASSARRRRSRPCRAPSAARAPG